MRERGASGLSYVAVAVIAALLVSGVALALTPASVSASLGSAVCQILQLPGCADAGPWRSQATSTAGTGTGSGRAKRGARA